MYAVRLVFSSEIKYDDIRERMKQLDTDLDASTTIFTYKTAQREVQVILFTGEKAWTRFSNSAQHDVLLRDLNELGLTSSEMGFDAEVLVR